jgi:hypothetical protein
MYRRKSGGRHIGRTTMTRFSKLEMRDGMPVETDVKFIKQSDIMKCAHFILAPEHYRADGTCKCDDPNETVMKEWGYKFRKGQWQ